MSIMRTRGMGKVVLSTTPKGVNHFKELYDMNTKILHIKNYNKDLTRGVFYGWDVISADETDESYLFQLQNRTDIKLRVYITLGRVLQYSSLPYYPEMMYQCYIHDDEGSWSSTQWFRGHDITYKNFWQVVEETITNHYLPF